MLKRIFATVSDKDFYQFLERAQKEGMDLGEALAAIAHCYATGASFNLKPFKKHLETLNKEVDYVKAHETLAEAERT